MAAGDRQWGTRTIRQYERISQIGEGTYGKVYKARETETGELCAIKQVKLPSEYRRPKSGEVEDETTAERRRRRHDQEGFPKTAVREVRVLTDPRLKGRSMVALREVVTATVDDERPNELEENAEGGATVADRSGTVYMIFEYVDYDLAGLIMSEGLKFSGRAVKSLFFQLLTALDRLHREGFVHRDIKTSNLLVTDDYVLKLADFGFTRRRPRMQGPMTDKVVTLWYRAPELLLGEKRYDDKIDMWSAGCVFVEMFKGSPLFRFGDETRALKDIFRAVGLPPSASYLTRLPNWSQVTHRPGQRAKLPELLKRYELSPQGADLALKLLEADPTKRLSAKEALAHPYFMREAPRVHAANVADGLGRISEHIDPSLDYHEYTARHRRKREDSRQAQESSAAATALGPSVSKKLSEQKGSKSSEKSEELAPLQADDDEDVAAKTETDLKLPVPPPAPIQKQQKWLEQVRKSATSKARQDPDRLPPPSQRKGSPKP